MRLAREESYPGYFWLPRAENAKVPGTLSIDESGACLLSLMGFFGSLEEAFRDTPDNHDTIFGVVDGSHAILKLCQYRNRNLSLGAGISKSTYYVGHAFLSPVPPTSGEIHLSRIDVEFEGLDEWIGKSGIRVEHDWEHRSAAITYTPLEDIVFIVNGFEVVLAWRWTLPSGGFKTESKISQRAMLSIRPPTPVPFTGMQEIVHRLLNFFRLVMGEAVAIQALAPTSPQIVLLVGEERSHPSFKVFYENIGESKKAPKLSWHTMLFQYKHLADVLEASLRAWLGNYEKLSPAFALYFAVLSEAFPYMENRFLALTQGLETLHRRTCSDALLPADAFERLRNQIIKASPEEAHDWLGERLEYANELTLRMRLKRLVKPFAAYFGNANSRDDFITSVVSTRNYFTHYGPKLEPVAARGLELHYLCERLEALFHLQLLMLAEVPKDLIDSMVTESRMFSAKLNPDIA